MWVVGGTHLPTSLTTHQEGGKIPGSLPPGSFLTGRTCLLAQSIHFLLFHALTRGRPLGAGHAEYCQWLVCLGQSAYLTRLTNLKPSSLIAFPVMQVTLWFPSDSSSSLSSVSNSNERKEGLISLVMPHKNSSWGHRGWQSRGCCNFIIALLVSFWAETSLKEGRLFNCHYLPLWGEGLRWTLLRADGQHGVGWQEEFPTQCPTCEHWKEKRVVHTDIYVQLSTLIFPVSNLSHQREKVI